MISLAVVRFPRIAATIVCGPRRHITKRLVALLLTLDLMLSGHPSR